MTEEQARELNERLGKIERRNKFFDDRIMVVTTVLLVIAFVVMMSNLARS